MILASGSPRRLALLKEAGLDFTVVKAQGKENKEGPFPQAIVMGLAIQQAREVAEDHPEDLVLGADTLVYLEGKALGKPKDKKEARAMLEALSGKAHEVYTGFSFVQMDKKLKVIDYDVTKVYFKNLSPEEINHYLEGDEWEDKAGAYGIQGRAGDFVDHIEGDINTVIGLPLDQVLACYKSLETLDYD